MIHPLVFFGGTLDESVSMFLKHKASINTVISISFRISISMNVFCGNMCDVGKGNDYCYSFNFKNNSSTKQYLVLGIKDF
jgi:hypothetical protein